MADEKKDLERNPTNNPQGDNAENVPYDEETKRAQERIGDSPAAGQEEDDDEETSE